MLEQLHVVLVVFFGDQKLGWKPFKDRPKNVRQWSQTETEPSNLKTRAFIPSPFAASCETPGNNAAVSSSNLDLSTPVQASSEDLGSQPSPQVKSKRQHAFPCPAAVSSVYSLLFSTPQTSSASPRAFFKASNRLLFLFPIILSVFFFSISAILSQFEIRLIDPSTLTTMGPR